MRNRILSFFSFLQRNAGQSGSDCPSDKKPRHCLGSLFLRFLEDHQVPPGLIHFARGVGCLPQNYFFLFYYACLMWHLYFNALQIKWSLSVCTSHAWRKFYCFIKSCNAPVFKKDLSLYQWVFTGSVYISFAMQGWFLKQKRDRDKWVCVC